MKIDQQVTSLEISKKLRELGVKQESLFYWWWTMSEKPRLIDVSKKRNMEILRMVQYSVSAFTVAELGEMLPWKIGNYQINFRKNDLNGEGWDVQYIHEDGEAVMIHDDNQVWESADTEADARGGMLIYLLDNKIRLCTR